MGKNTVFITGTSSGIGKGLALFFLDLDFTVVGCSRRVSDITDTNYHHYLIDFESTKEIEEAISNILLAFDDGIDIFISNAGKIDRGLVLMETSEATRGTYATNIVTPVIISKLVSLHMIKKNKSGILIYLSSVASFLDDIGTATYSSSKSALETFCRIFDKEVMRFGLRALTLRIALVESPMTSSFTENEKSEIILRSGGSQFRTTNEIGNFVIDKFSNQAQIGDTCVFQ